MEYIADSALDFTSYIPASDMCIMLIFCRCWFHSGFFLYPTIFTDVTDNMFIAKEESFGPIMIVSRFADG